jgi:hypothetical protein
MAGSPSGFSRPAAGSSGRALAIDDRDALRQQHVGDAEKATSS